MATQQNWKFVQVRLKPLLHAWLHAEAHKQERSANWLLNKLLEDASGVDHLNNPVARLGDAPQ